MGSELDARRFSSWSAAAQRVGLVYMFAERLFYGLSFLSPRGIRFWIVRNAQGLAVPKFDPIRKDVYNIGWFFLVGIVAPVMLATRVPSQAPSIYMAIAGVYIVLLEIQEHVNVTLFDPFRGERLPVPQASSRVWQSLDAWSSRILPLDRQATDMSRFQLTSGQRRIPLAVMDFWLLLVGYAVIYWAALPTHFNVPLCEFASALYFSVVAGTTLGFGDIVPRSSEARLVAAAETLSCFLFAVIIIAHALDWLPRVRRLED